MSAETKGRKKPVAAAKANAVPERYEVKILNMDEADIPASLYSNHVLANRVGGEFTLIFAQVRLPIRKEPGSEAVAKRMAEEGITPKFVAAVTMPESLLDSVYDLLGRMKETRDREQWNA